MDVNAPYLSVPNYARHINCSVRNLYRLIERGVVPSIKLGYKCVRIPVAKADAHLDSLATGGSVAASKLASL
jgi:excisionase family DNA binding protein